MELPLAPFFLKKFRGAYCDINDLPTLDPELYRWAHATPLRRVGMPAWLCLHCISVNRRCTLTGRHAVEGCQQVCKAAPGLPAFSSSGWLQCSLACASQAAHHTACGLPGRRRPTPWPACSDLGVRRAARSNLVFLKHYDGDVADLNLTFTITDNVLGATREVRPLCMHACTHT